jgi:glycerophosphoryl diester phosphodiesterase
MKHPTYFASIGLPTEDRMLDALKRNDLDSATAPVFVQCFEVMPLKTLRPKTRAKLVLLVSSEGGPADLPGVKYADLITPEGLKDVAAYADGLGPEKTLVIPRTPTRCCRPPPGEERPCRRPAGASLDGARRELLPAHVLARKATPRARPSWPSTAT